MAIKFPKNTGRKDPLPYTNLYLYCIHCILPHVPQYNVPKIGPCTFACAGTLQSTDYKSLKWFRPKQTAALATKQTMRVMKGIKLLFMLALALGVKRTDARHQPSSFRVLTGSEARDQELGQNPELQDIVARTGEKVIINITGADSLAVVQEGVNALLDCFPYLSMFPGGQVTWFLQRIDEFGNPIGVQTQLFPPLGSIVVEGQNNRYLNITRTNIVAIAEYPHSRIYTCRVCSNQGGCHNASTTLYLLGEPPNIDCGEPNEGIMLLCSACACAHALRVLITNQCNFLPS